MHKWQPGAIMDSDAENVGSKFSGLSSLLVGSSYDVNPRYRSSSKQPSFKKS
jgi:hypothetical protein